MSTFNICYNEFGLVLLIYFVVDFITVLFCYLLLVQFAKEYYIAYLVCWQLPHPLLCQC